MEKEKKYLYDVLSAIELVDDFIRPINDFSAYSADLKTKSAIERQLGIIGEAVNKYLKINDTNSLDNARKIVSFRNWLVHAYDTIDDTIVWAIIHRHLPALKQEVLAKIHTTS